MAVRLGGIRARSGRTDCLFFAFEGRLGWNAHQSGGVYLPKRKYMERDLKTLNPFGTPVE